MALVQSGSNTVVDVEVLYKSLACYRPLSFHNWPFPLRFNPFFSASPISPQQTFHEYQDAQKYGMQDQIDSLLHLLRYSPGLFRST